MNIKHWVSRHFQDFLGLAIAVILLIFVSTTSPPLSDLRQDEQSMLSTNITYLKNIDTEAREDFGKLSAILGFMRVVESSQVGVSFFADVNVTIGQALSEFSNVIEKAMLATALSGTAANLLVIISEISASFGPQLMAIFFSALSLLFFSRIVLGKDALPSTIIESITEFSLLIAVFTLIVIPLSINLSAEISSQITAELKQEQRTNLRNMHKSMAAEPTGHGLVSRAKDAVHNFEEKISHLKHKTDLMVQYFIKSMATALIDVVLLPLFLMLGVYTGFKRLMRPIFNRWQL